MKKLALLIGLFAFILFIGITKATCDGISFSCNYFNESICPSQDGCSYINTSGCSGTGDCMAFFGDQATCEAYGCTYGVPFPPMCSGSFDCSPVPDQPTCDNVGCSWTSPHCEGTHTICSSLNDSVCSDNIGCFLSSEASICNSCDDCSIKLHAGKNVTLTNDISGYNNYYGIYTWGNCIWMDNSSTTLNCNGHWILGDNYSSNIAGIYMYGELGASNLIVRNCFVTGYSIGLLAVKWSNPYLVENSIFCQPYADKVCSGYKLPIMAQHEQNNRNNVTYNNVTTYGNFYIERQSNIIIKNSNLISTNYSTQVLGFFITGTEYFWILNNTFNSTGSYVSLSGSYIAVYNNNYWLNFNGTGFSDTCNDTNDDGICDTSYVFSAGTDYYPLKYTPPAPPAPAPEYRLSSILPYPWGYIVGIVLGAGFILFILATLLGGKIDDLLNPKNLAVIMVGLVIVAVFIAGIV